jgi:LCP family protein required for cell wall assembly
VWVEETSEDMPPGDPAGDPEADQRHPDGTAAARKRHTTRNVLLFFLVLFLAAATVAGMFVFSLASSFDSKTQKIPAAFPAEALRPAPAPPAPAGTLQAMNVLVMGSDSRAASVDTAEAGSASDQRSDTMMWVHIPADRKGIDVMSVMRDTWVNIPGHGEAKMNAALAYGGVPLVVQTLEGMFNTRLDHVAIVDFQGFKDLTDSLGGVDVRVPIPFDSYQLHGKHFDAGPQHMDGATALAFVRERYAFVDGDYQRVRDQQIFLKAVLAKVFNADTLANPLKISTAVAGFAPYVTVDKTLDATAAGTLAWELRGLRPADLVSFTLPTKGTGWSPDGQQSIVLRDDAAIAQLGDAFSKDTLGNYLRSTGLDKGN